MKVWILISAHLCSSTLCKKAMYYERKKSERNFIKFIKRNMQQEPSAGIMIV